MEVIHLTITYVSPRVVNVPARVKPGDLALVQGYLTFDSSYPTGGEAFSLASKFTTLKYVSIPAMAGYVFSYDYSALKVLAYRQKNITAETMLFTDADGAAAAGVVLYAHTNDGVYGWLEFVSPTNVDGLIRLTAAGTYLYLRDSDNAATLGAQVYFDEDAATADSRLLAATLCGRDLLIPTSGGQFIRVVYNATPATPGVAPYFDEDAANNYGRVQFVSPTNANGSLNLDDSYLALCNYGNNLTEVGSTTDLSALTSVPFFAVGIA